MTNICTDDDTFHEFKVEAEELLDEAERNLLALDQGKPFEENFNSIFRVFHSLKGAAGMLDLKVLQEHMHKIENLFQNLKSIGRINKKEIDFFLRSVDAAKKILEGIEVKFEYDLTLSDQALVPLKKESPTVTVLEGGPEKDSKKSQPNSSGHDLRVITMNSVSDPETLAITGTESSSSFETYMLLKDTIGLLFAQFIDLEEYFRTYGRDADRDKLRATMETLVDRLKKLKSATKVNTAA